MECWNIGISSLRKHLNIFHRLFKVMNVLYVSKGLHVVHEELKHSLIFSKAFFIILLLLPLISTSPFAQTPEELMNRANGYYQNEQWNEAIETYEQILNQGYEGAALYYNLGNSYFKSGNLGRAILNYERALKLEPGDDDVEFNLRLANARTVDRIREVPKLFLLEWWDLIVASLTPGNWALLVILFYLLLLVSIGLYLLTGNLNLQKLSIYSGIVSFAALIILVIILISAVNNKTSYDHGILLTGIATAKVSPDEQSSDAFIIHEGLKFEIQDQVSNWSKIKLADGKIGWLPQDTFEKI